MKILKSRKKYLFLLSLSLLGNILFATSFSSEYFIIENYMDQILTMQIEFNEEKGNVVDESTNYMWSQAVCDIQMIIENYNNLSTHKNKLLQVKSNRIISYMPNYAFGDLEVAYTKMRDIPILDKLHGIIKSLIITDSNGNVIFTLDDLREEDLRIDGWGNSIYYIFDIHD